VERILWADAEVVLRVDASGERLTGGAREGMVRVRGR